MKKYIWAAVLFVAAAVLNGSAPRWLAVMDGKPDFLLTVAILYSGACGTVAGGFLGFVAGLISGGLAGTCLGTFLFTRTAACAAAGSLKEYLFGDTPLVPSASVFVLTLLAEGVFLLANPPARPAPAFRAVLGEAVLNTLFALVGYTIYLHIAARGKDTLR
ncbi:MAG: hypothetical protein J6332_06275 [Abditibacteriota bacterium]|nr:hypothetical protein [Abditibacteriota bacterium]